jgi:hypothetical protein
LKRVGSSIVALRQSAVIGPTPGVGHELADLHIITGKLQNFTIEIGDLLLDPGDSLLGHSGRIQENDYFSTI